MTKLQANNYDLFRCQKLAHKVVRLAVLCTFFATLCLQNTWQITITELLTLLTIVIVWNNFMKENDLQ